MKRKIKKDIQFYKFCLYGFLKNLKFFDAFIILFFREMGFSFLKIGLLFSIREIATNILEMPTGVVADSYGRRKSMILAFSSYIISFLIFYFFPSFSLYVVAMIFFALGEAFRSGTHKAMILEYLKIKNMTDIKVFYYGNTRACSQFGSAISSIIAAFLVFLSGDYKIIFIATIIPYILALILMITYPKELDGEIRKYTSSSHIKNFIKNSIATIKEFFNIFKNPLTVKVIFNTSIFEAFFKSTKDYLQPIVKTYVLSIPFLLYLNQDKRVSILIGIVYFTLYIFTSLASKNSGYFVNMTKSLTSAVNITFLIEVLIIFLAGLFFYLKIYILVIIIFILNYILFNIRKPIMVSYVSDLISSRIMATGLSLESQVKTILIAILSPFIGFLVDKTGIGNTLIILSLILLVLYFIIKIKKTSKIS